MIALAALEAEDFLAPLLEEFVWKEQFGGRLPLVAVTMLAVAAGIWLLFGRQKEGFRVTAVYWLGCGVGTWLAMYLPVGQVLSTSALVIAMVSLLFAYLPYLHHRREQRRTWLTRPEVLTRRFAVAPGLTSSMTALSLLVLFFALCHVTSAASAVATLLMGVALLVVVDHGFRADAAFSGLALISLAPLSGLLAITGGESLRIATILNLALLVLGVWAFLWTWLAGVWQQQIVRGRPLTTAARLVGLAVHAGVMTLAFASLLLFKLAVWPQLRTVSELDDGPGRFAMLAAGGIVVAGVSLWIAVRRDSRTMGLLFLVNLLSLALAYVLRMPNVLYDVVAPYLPVWLIAAGLVVLLIALLARRRQWSGLAAPSALLATVVLPALLIASSVHLSSGFGLRIAMAILLASGAWALLRFAGSPAKAVRGR